MNRVLITNHKEQACGVYQYGKRVAFILTSSADSEFEYYYREISSKEEYLQILKEIDPKIIVHNYLNITMPWFDQECLNKGREIAALQGLLVHNIGYAACFDFYLHQNPDYPQNGDNYPICRPLFSFPQNYQYPKNTIPIIGTFGFGFLMKRYENIVSLVNEQFEEAEIKLHLTKSKFFPNDGELAKIAELCRQAITKEGIKLTITDDFKTDDEILEFLAGNDLNIFLYQNYNNYNGISSVIDYALSVDRPIAVCKSNMFSHINNNGCSICVENSSLKDIMNNGSGVLKEFKNSWSQDSFRKSFSQNLQSVLKSYA